MATLAIAISEEVLTNGKLMDKRPGAVHRAFSSFRGLGPKTKVFANGGGCRTKGAAVSPLLNLFR
jgi:hypothetical protein